MNYNESEVVMGIDERLDRLTERHEALTQSVEMMRLAQEEEAARSRENNAEIKKQFEQVAILFKQTDDFINTLAKIAKVHEERLDALDGGDRT